MNTGKITRFEVIDETGRALTRWNVSVMLSLQDDGRTLKVFIGPREVPVEEISDK